MQIDRSKMNEFISGGVFTKEFLDFLFKEPEATLVYYNSINKFYSIRDWHKKKDLANDFYLHAHRRVGRKIDSFSDVISIMGSSFSSMMQAEIYKGRSKVNMDLYCDRIDDISNSKDGSKPKTESYYWMNRYSMLDESYKEEKNYGVERIKLLSGDNYQIVKMYLDGYGKKEIGEITGRNYAFVHRYLRNVASELARLNIKSNRRIENTLFA